MLTAVWGTPAAEILAPPDGQPTVLTAVRGTQTTATPPMGMLAVTMLTAEMLAPLDVQPAGAGHSSRGNAGNGNAGSRNRCQAPCTHCELLVLHLFVGTEWYGISKRSFSIILTHAAFSVGLMVLAGMAYAVREWRTLQLGLSVPLALTGIFFCILPESARWLLTQGKQEEAKKLILKAVNKRTVPETLLHQMEGEKSGKTGSVLDLFRIPRLRRITLIMSYIWYELTYCI
ncbi:solute carrier family 22 member 13-like [Acipenser ruthenus]|uniref:solute carrier family 22 member 13-like n=1 Tax=Acipenser ruthenus TaxID=7906 RepID=UPI00274116DB|nr:solute carrier family 22 member 13-like [Acipenser ruthenus]